MAELTEIGSIISSMTDHSKIGMSIIHIMNPARICSKQDCVTDSTEISSKDVCMMIHMRGGPSSAGPRTKFCQDGDQAQ